MESSSKKGRRGVKSRRRSGRKGRIGMLMAWEREEDEQGLRSRTHNAVSRRLPPISLYGDFFTRNA
jgi:hypothetical protein